MANISISPKIGDHRNANFSILNFEEWICSRKLLQMLNRALRCWIGQFITVFNGNKILGFKGPGFEFEKSPYYLFRNVQYVDDCMTVGHDPISIMQQISEDEIKGDTWGLGAGIEKFTIDGMWCWRMRSDKYVKNVAQIVKYLFPEDDQEIKGGEQNHDDPVPVNYKPESDTSDECNPEMTSCFHQFIGILQWSIELNWFDMLTEVSLLSQCQAAPCKGLLKAICFLVNFLSKHPMKGFVFGPTVPVLMNEFSVLMLNWLNFQVSTSKRKIHMTCVNPWANLWSSVPGRLGKHVVISCFVVVNHAGNEVTRRSHTGILIFFLSNTVIIVYSNRQNTVESATFGSKFVTMRVARDLLVALKIKPQSFGIHVFGPENVFSDNDAIHKNISLPESLLIKKHNTINFHICREAVVAKMMREPKQTLTRKKQIPWQKWLHARGSRICLATLYVIVRGKWFLHVETQMTTCGDRLNMHLRATV